MLVRVHCFGHWLRCEWPFATACRLETRMTDEEVQHGISRNALRAAERMGSGEFKKSVVERPTEQEAREVSGAAAR